MTADNADGDAMSPPTHFAIKPCCLICVHLTTNYEGAVCGMHGDVPEHVCLDCENFTLRDFGYPVRKVEIE